MKRHPRSSIPKAAAFTLVELLVVVIIIAALATIAFPVLANIQERARGTKCAGNLRQLGVAFALYAGDHNGFLPPVQLNGSGVAPTWCRYVSPYLGRTLDDAFGALSPESPYPGHMNCPSTKATSVDSYSYAVNYMGAPNFTTYGVFGWPLYGGSHKLANIRPGCFLAADTPPDNPFRFLIMNGLVDPWISDYDDDGVLDSSGSLPYGGVAPRHQGGANFLMADGSVRWLGKIDWATNKDDLWQL